MANIATPGIFWAKNKDGGNKEPRERGVVITAQSGAIAAGDPVKRVNDGTFVVAAAGDSFYGFCAGIERYKNSAGQIVSGNRVPTSTAYTGAPSLANEQATVIYITPARGQLFYADCDTAQTTLTTAQTLVGNNVDFVIGTSSATTGRSATVIDGTTFATTTAQARLVEIVQDPLNDVTAANWKGLIEINETTEPPIGTATGV